MSTPVVPAWKKLGLKVKEDIRKDPLTGQVQATPVDNNKSDTNNNNKRPADNNENNNEIKTKKPPKRVKLPKAERKAPPESDNLVYLRQYHLDKTNWKFSKQKQNWILKNVYEIEADYADNLMAYLKGLQGGARERITQESFEVITHWNEYMKAPAEPEEDEVEEKQENPTTTDETTKDNNDEKATKKADKKEDAPPPPPTEPKARRAQSIFNLLTGNLVPLELLEEEATTMPDAATTTADNEPPVAEQEALESEEPEKKTEEKKDKKEKKSKKEKKDKSSKKSHK